MKSNELSLGDKMLLYVIKAGKFENYVIETKSNSELYEKKFLLAEKIFQLLDTKDNKRFLVELFNSENKETFLLPELNGNYYFSLEGVTDMMELKEMPDIKQVSREVYTNLASIANQASYPLMEGN